MTETLEKLAVTTPSVEELQALVDGPRKCNIFQVYKAPWWIRLVGGAFGMTMPKCDEPAVAHYDLRCTNCGEGAEFWLCVEHERVLLEGASKASAGSGCFLEMRRL